MMAHIVTTGLYSISLERQKKTRKRMKIVFRNKFSPNTLVLSNNAANKGMVHLKMTGKAEISTRS